VIQSLEAALDLAPVLRPSNNFLTQVSTLVEINGTKFHQAKHLR
jgi:hypothetical protein